jgi:hypothetical protein
VHDKESSQSICKKTQLGFAIGFFFIAMRACHVGHAQTSISRVVIRVMAETPSDAAAVAGSAAEPQATTGVAGALVTSGVIAAGAGPSSGELQVSVIPTSTTMTATDAANWLNMQLEVVKPSGCSVYFSKKNR